MQVKWGNCDRFQYQPFPMGNIAAIDPPDLAWAQAMSQVRAAMLARALRPSDVVVLVPYAQLIQQARLAWVAIAGAGFMPRFESTLNWPLSLGAVPVGDDDLRFDAAVDMMTARSLLMRAGLGEHQALLSPRLLDAARSLAPVAAAVEPGSRAAWGRQMADRLAPTLSPVLQMESAVASVALAWVANSGYATDALFAAQPALLVVLDGFQSEPLVQALVERLGDRCLRLPLDSAPAAGELDLPNAAGIDLHGAADAEDEAELAAACVLKRLQTGRNKEHAGHVEGVPPVALVALDRQLTRRVRAMLGEQGVAIRDETGWKLSTTRAAASVVTLLGASQRNASADDVLEWLKHICTPALQTQNVEVLEREFRQMGLRDWPESPPAKAGAGDQNVAAAPEPFTPSTGAVVAWANQQRGALQRSRHLAQWLDALQTALGASGQLGALAGDAAGRQVLQALHLPALAEPANSPGQLAPITADSAVLAHARDFGRFTQRLSAGEFRAWVVQVLEAANFSPPHPAHAQVVILPLAQLLGRTFAAVVMPGCDDETLTGDPEPPGPWTPVQRELLGLPSRHVLAAALRDAWRYALRQAQIDLVWRQSDAGEPRSASPLVQTLRLMQPMTLAGDPRPLRSVQAVPGHMPQPVASALPVRRLSASAYGDLRSCPYRFFALRQLGLLEAQELDADLDKRDFGNWLHQVLHIFHERLKNAEGDGNSGLALASTALTAMINVAADEATRALGLSGPDFLPFAASWPRVRDGYLKWLAGHAGQGARYGEGEVWKETPLGPLTLVGKLDRVDHLADGSVMVMDYKTESSQTSRQRIAAGMEDSQLAFYAALVHDDSLAAAYVNVGEKDGTSTVASERIVELRDALIEGIQTDMARVAAGAPMPALGEGKACDYCAARGLCRKDYWN